VLSLAVRAPAFGRLRFGVFGGAIGTSSHLFLKAREYLQDLDDWGVNSVGGVLQDLAVG
jgi:hypothetical protein